MKKFVVSLVLPSLLGLGIFWGLCFLGENIVHIKQNLIFFLNNIDIFDMDCYFFIID